MLGWIGECRACSLFLRSGWALLLPLDARTLEVLCIAVASCGRSLKSKGSRVTDSIRWMDFTEPRREVHGCVTPGP